jgi:hypothetical protein
LPLPFSQSVITGKPSRKTAFLFSQVGTLIIIEVTFQIFIHSKILSRLSSPQLLLQKQSQKPDISTINVKPFKNKALKGENT